MKMTLNGVLSTFVKVAGMSTGIAVWCMALLVFSAIIARFVFNYGIAFAADYATFLTAFVCFVGACYVQQVRGHVRVDLVLRRLPEKAQRWLEVVTLFIFLAFCLVLFYWAMRMIKLAIEMKSVFFSAVATPQAIPQSFMAVGLLLLSLMVLAQLVTAVKGLRSAQAERANVERRNQR